MYRLNPAFTAGVVALFCVATVLIGGRGGGIIAGTPRLLPAIQAAASTPTAAAAETPPPSYPDIFAAMAPAARRGLPAGDTFTLHVVQSSSYTVALAAQPAPPAAPRPEPPKIHRQASPQHHQSWFGYTPPAPPAPKPTPVQSAPVVAAPPPPPPSPPKIEAVSAMTFSELDGALQASPTTQSLDERSQKGGVTMRILSAGKVVDRDAIKIAVANTGSSPFFISLFRVSAGQAIANESVGPYVANPGEEVAVIVHFAADAAAGKKVILTMIESGGEHRKFVMTPDHVF